MHRFVLGPLDGARRMVYRSLAPVLGPWIRNRDVRVGLHGTSVVLGAFVMAVVVPLPLLLLSPLVLGVPHLMADVRYLVAQPGLARRGLAWGLIAALLLLSAVTLDLRWGLVGAALAPWATPGSAWRRILAGAGLSGLAALGFLLFEPTVVALAHAHNLVAIVLWTGIAVSLDRIGSGGGAARMGPVVLAAGGALLLLTGALDPWLATSFGWGRLGGMALSDHAAQLAPGLSGPWPARWVATFAFGQAVHYGIWLRVLPEDARGRPSPRTFRASWQALRDDLGDGLLAVSLLGFAGIATWATWDLVAARSGYLRLALFHGPLELAVLGAWATQGRAFWTPTPAS